VAMFGGRCFVNDMSLVPGHVMKFPLLMAFVQVVMEGLPQQPCRNWANSVFVLSLRMMAFTEGEVHFLIAGRGWSAWDVVGTGMSHKRLSEFRVPERMQASCL
jgi:hypothetical protein